LGTALQWKEQKTNTMEMRVSGMLIRYKKSCEKIAMGLLSFMPLEKDLKKLKQTMRRYEENPNWQLYLWKKGDDFIGLIGVEVNDSSFTVHHISVMPSYRGEGIGLLMVDKIQDLLKPLEMLPTEETRGFLELCREKRESYK
jgi:riboflavin biosynthesis RibT protein